MSVRIWSRVVAESRGRTPTEQLMLCLIADFARDDGGGAYPSIATLAHRCRIKPRHASNILQALKNRGLIEIALNGGPRGANLYRVVFENQAEPTHSSAEVSIHSNAGVQSSAPLHPTATTPALGCGNPCIGVHQPPVLECMQPVIDPSFTRHKPCIEPAALFTSASHQRSASILGSKKVSSEKKSTACPYKEIIALYHTSLPELPRTVVETKGRQRAMGKFWNWVLTSKKGDDTRRAETPEQALRWFAEYFERASQNDFLMGRIERSKEHKNWRCTLDFLLTDEGKKHVIERTKVSE